MYSHGMWRKFARKENLQICNHLCSSDDLPFNDCYFFCSPHNTWSYFICARHNSFTSDTISCNQARVTEYCTIQYFFHLWIFKAIPFSRFSQLIKITCSDVEKLYQLNIVFLFDSLPASNLKLRSRKTNWHNGLVHHFCVLQQMQGQDH